MALKKLGKLGKKIKDVTLNSADEDFEGAIHYEMDTRLTDLPEERPPGGFSLELTLQVCRVSNFCYFEKSGCYWQSSKRNPKGFFVAQPSDMSVGLMRAAGMIKGVRSKLRLQFVDSKYDQDFDNGAGTLRSGIMKERRTDTDLVIMHSVEDRALVIVWRGTESLLDMQSNLAMWTLPWPYKAANGGTREEAADTESQSTSKDDDDNSDVQSIPAGFHKAHESVIAPLLYVLKQLWATGQYDRIVTGGHSLGGALAHLNAHALSYLMYDELRGSALPWVEALACYSIGAPKCANRAFRNDYAQRVPHSYRIVNENDVIPLLPPTRRSHVGVPVLVEEDNLYVRPSTIVKREISRTGTLRRYINDHMPPRYLATLCGLAVKRAMTSTEYRAVDAAWTAYVTATTIVRTTFSVQLPDNTDQSKAPDPLRLTVTPITVKTPSSEAPMYSILREAFGEQRARDEVLTRLSLYARKCAESHFFRPSEVEYDDEPLTVHNFRIAVWELIAHPDEQDKNDALELVRMREMFDRIDKDVNGLITAEEFSQIVRERMSSTAAKNVDQIGPEYLLHTTMQDVYAKKSLKYIELTAPVELSFPEFLLWADVEQVHSQNMKAYVEDLLKR